MPSISTSTSAAPKRRRVPAEERREDVLRVAAEVVARDGMHAASTAEIAKRAGISHAYLFRLFPSKEELLIEVSHRAGHALHGELVAAGERARALGQDPLEAMATAWSELLEDRTNLNVSLQAITASESIPVLGEHLRRSWAEVVADIERISGATPDEVRAFVAQGMLLLVVAGLRAEEADWVTRLHGGPLPCSPARLGIGVPGASDPAAPEELPAPGASDPAAPGERSSP